MKASLFFFLKVIGVYAILVFPWPGVMNAYSAVFRTVGDYTFGSPGFFGPGSMSRFHPLPVDAPHRDQGYDTDLVLKNLTLDRHREILFKSRHAYLPTAMFLALVLATGLPWARRGKALLWGLLWMHLFLGFKMALLLADAFSGGALMTLELSNTTKQALSLASKIISQAAAPSFIVPVIVWGLTIFRGEDLADFARGFQRKVAK